MVCIFDERMRDGRHVIRIHPPMTDTDPIALTARITAVIEEEIRVNTQNFTRLIEDAARRHPDHWLWVHRRWKTRPPGEPPLYPF